MGHREKIGDRVGRCVILPVFFSFSYLGEPDLSP